jgi:thiamine-triphosphatase
MTICNIPKTAYIQRLHRLYFYVLSIYGMSLLEIERKFFFNLSLLHQFRLNRGTPAFQALVYLGQKTMHDVYYDKRVDNGSRMLLSSNGIWLRQRNGEWQAKARHRSSVWGSDSPLDVGTVFKELLCPAEIHALLSRYMQLPPLDESVHRRFGLDMIADFTACREKYHAGSRFHVVLDHTNFGHRVGEVEVMALSADAVQAQHDIDAFMAKYAWFFVSTGGRPIRGKLAAYLERFP